jgi:hypothetical protein
MSGASAQGSGASVPEQALVCDQAAERLDPSGFDPSREDCPLGCGWCGYECPAASTKIAETLYESDDRGLFCKHCGRSHILHFYTRGVGFMCSRDSDGSGVADETGTGSAEGDSAGPQGIANKPPNPKD